MTESNLPPRSELVRAKSLEFRESEDEGGMPKLTGTAIPFNEWTTIRSHWEGEFQERIAPGAVTKTLKENRDIKILFEHGQDATFQNMPIAPTKLVADEKGVRYDEPELYDDANNRRLMPRLRDGLLGSSFKFTVLREDFEAKPERSEDNPDGLPRRTVQEMKLYDVGPVVYPAYAGGTAGLRSMSDEFRRFTLEEAEELFERWAQDPERLKRLAGLLGGELGAHIDPIPTGEEVEATGGVVKTAEVPTDESASPSDKHSTSAGTPSHSGSRRLYGPKDPKPSWKLEKE